MLQSTVIGKMKIFSRVQKLQREIYKRNGISLRFLLNLKFRRRELHHERKCPGVHYFATHTSSDIPILFSSRCWVRADDWERDKRSLKSPFTWLSAFHQTSCTCNKPRRSKWWSETIFCPASDRPVSDWCEMCGFVCKCLCSLFIAPGLQRAEAEASVRELHTPEELCTPVHPDTVATMSRNSRRGQAIRLHVYNSQFKQQFEALQLNLMFAERPSARLSPCVMRLSIYWLYCQYSPRPGPVHGCQCHQPAAPLARMLSNDFLTPRHTDTFTVTLWQLLVRVLLYTISIQKVILLCAQ